MRPHPDWLIKEPYEDPGLGLLKSGKEAQVNLIDFPQAVDIAAIPQSLNFVHADIVNICAWFTRKGLAVDAEALFGDLRIAL